MKENYSQELQEVVAFYAADFNKSQLETHLEVFSSMEIWTLTYIQRHSQTLQISIFIPNFSCIPGSSSCEICLANAVSERSASTMRRIKTYLRTTMTQS